MPDQDSSTPKLKVAIIGAGPAGLGAAIEIAKLPFIEWKLYEKGDVVKEIGAGISIQPNTWRMLEKLGAAKNISAKDIFRPLDEHYVQHRNGRTGALLVTHYQTKNAGPHQLHARAHRAKLQNALLREVDETNIRLSKKLVNVQQQSSGKLLISFSDGFEDEVDLLIGADGIRSVVRSVAFPNHKIKYTGRVSYRTLIKTEDVQQINGLPNAVIFWHAPQGKWAYTCNLGGNVYEITVMVQEPPDGKERVSWGQEAAVQQMLDHFPEFCPPVKAILALATNVQQYALFAGPRLESAISHDRIALVGDASHPLSGAFGDGAGFALEDVYTLAQSLRWAHDRSKAYSDGLRLFDHVRSQHYKALYDILDHNGAVGASVDDLGLSFDENVALRVDRIWNYKNNWMHYYQVDKALEKAIQEADNKGSLVNEGVGDPKIRPNL